MARLQLANQPRPKRMTRACGALCACTLALLCVGDEAARADPSEIPPRYRTPRHSLELSYSDEEQVPTVATARVSTRPVLIPPIWRHDIAGLTDIASAFEQNKRFDFRFTIGYQHRELRGQIKREVSGALMDQATALDFRDLVFARSRDELSLRAEVGLYRDLSLHVELPIVLSDQTELSYDRGASPCSLPPAPSATCIAAENSSTVADGLVGATGYDAQRAGAGTSGGLLFRGTRRGAAVGSGTDALDTLHFGLSWAPLSPRRDPTKPLWLIAFEPRLSIGSLRGFDRSAPDSNHGVADGVHRLLFRTAVSRRIGRIEPYFSIFYLLPIARTGSAFVDYGPAQKIKDPQHQAGGVFGAEIVAYERGRPDWRVAIDVRARLEGHFLGRGYSEAWELFAGSPALACDASRNPACDASQTQNAYQARPHSGVTVIDSYATLGVELAVDARLTRYFRLRAGIAYARDQSHLITGDDVGTPTQPGGRVSAPAEYNPAYRPVIDQVGRRYLVDNVDQLDAKVTAQLLF